MKIRPVILCGGEGSRLWPNSKNNQAKQFINFGDETLIEKTLKRIKKPIFDYPILSTNLKYLNNVKKYLKKLKIKKYKIILEPLKKNTAPAILSSALIKEIPQKQPLIFLPADHTMENINLFNKTILKNKKKLTNKNIFIFGIKPNYPSNGYGYFLSKKIFGNLNKVIKFIEKPRKEKAKKIIKDKGYWNSGMFFFRKDSIIFNFKKYSPNIYKSCLASVQRAKLLKKVYYLNKTSFNKVISKSFDYAILEKSDQIYAIKLSIPWSDLGSWREILKIYNKNKNKFLKRKNIYFRPWGKYINLFKGKNFLIKELTVNSKSSISLQKHYHRSEHWLITQGKAKITLNKNKFYKSAGDGIFIPAGTIHRVENLSKKPIKIMESQTGSVLKESDIVRFKDIYGRVK